ncbi:hypothetical protein MNB_SV-6-1833 [hydrothermal vent metagenome]|uniref:Uncharacterized protein n=1 Tax=hydrothermal vent metagenome TaxID=652676 RepID=A0A1W1BAU9_9ZZZZ
MKNSEKLKNFLKLELLPDLEVAIDELFAVIDKKKSASKDEREELDNLRDMRSECHAIIEDIDRGEIDDEEVDALLDELMDIKSSD